MNYQSITLNKLARPGSACGLAHRCPQLAHPAIASPQLGLQPRVLSPPFNTIAYFYKNNRFAYEVCWLIPV